ncbi:hypothetical protein [Shewanella marina]|uniref:hypothetical protein n=1 Tax=Shewanella marina TaxID=487319 RepID=UPI00046F7C39|nr:hypothetical protein [Shewanella marina]
MKNKSILLCTLLLASTPVAAKTWQLNGYASQGYVNVEDSQFIVGDKGDTFKASELGLAGSWSPWEHFRFAGAVNYRQFGNLADDDVEFDYLFAEYSYPVFENSTLGLRLGRTKNELGFYSSTRDVPFGRPSIMLPQSIYSDYFRDSQLHVDGGDLFGKHILFDGVFEWHATIGQLGVTDQFTENVLGSSELGKFDSEEYYAVDLDYQGDYLHLGLTYYKAAIGFHTANNNTYRDGKISVESVVGSIQYRYNWFEITAEYSFVDNGFKGIELASATDTSQYDSQGYYIDLRFYLPENVELFIRYDDHIANKDYPDGGNKPWGPYYGYTHDWTFGSRWTFADDWMLAAEYHQIEGASWVAPVAAPNPMTQAKDWSIFLMQLSYRFQW